MSNIGRVVKKIVDMPLDLLGVGGNDIPEMPQDDSNALAQAEADKTQSNANSALSRRRKRSLLASNMNTGRSNSQAKKLLGE